MKERIIGAIVLVAVVVLVVPVFLDGPSSDDEIVTERVRLPGQSEQQSQTVVLDRDREEPVPAQARPEAAVTGPAANAATEQDEAASEPPVSRRNSPEPSSAPTERPPPTTPPPRDTVAEAPAAAPTVEVATSASTTGMWAVQLGSFGSQENAENLAADLRKQGFAAFLSNLDSNGRQLHRVRIGPQKDRESAEAMAARLETAGHSGQVVPHP